MKQIIARLIVSLGVFALWVGLCAPSANASHRSRPDPVPLLGKIGAFTDPTTPSETDAYRIGDEWGKKAVSPDDLKDPAFQRSAFATASLSSGATAFYLGTFNGLHLVATNHHVCPSSLHCVGNYAMFSLLKVQTKITRLIGSWSEIDLALLAVTFPNKAAEDRLEPYAANFDFQNAIYPGQKLLTIGFGMAGNEEHKLMANQDSDCVVFSGANEFVLMGDPDSVNPMSYKAWSFANGCDVSHGDSGSAMVDRRTGRPIGILWTGKVPKPSRIQNSQFLLHLLAQGGIEIWTELTFAVPAAKIKSVLAAYATQPGVDVSIRTTLEEFLK
jgi:hypothetical protein